MRGNLQAEIDLIWLKRRKQITNIGNLVSKVSHQHSIDPNLILAIFMIESFKRPRILRFFERFVFNTNLAANRILNIPLRDMTLGPLQIRSSIIYERFGKYNVTFQDHLTTAAWHLESIQKDGIGIEEIGYLYNGSHAYGLVLRSLYRRLKQDQRKAA